MNLPENLPIHLDFQTLSLHQNESTAKRRAIRGVLRLALAVVIWESLFALLSHPPLLQKVDCTLTPRKRPQSIPMQWRHSIRWASTFVL